MRVVTTYDQLSAMSIRWGRCPGCNKKVRRQRTFTQTVNPFNRIDTWDGQRPKNRREVQASVDEQAALWKPEPEDFRHDGCKTGGE